MTTNRPTADRIHDTAAASYDRHAADARARGPQFMPSEATTAAAVLDHTAENTADPILRAYYAAAAQAYRDHAAAVIRANLAKMTAIRRQVNAYTEAQ